MRPLLHAETSKYMAEKAATRVNFCTFSLVPLSFINQSRWKLVKMCILISLTNHITATFLYDPFFMPKQANIWQQRQWRGSIFADFCLFLSHLLTEVPENWSKCVFWLAQPIILLQLFDKTPFSCQSENLQKLTHCAAFSVTYWPVLAWKWGRIKKLNKR